MLHLLHSPAWLRLFTARIALYFSLGLCGAPHALLANESPGVPAAAGNVAARAHAAEPPMLNQWRALVSHNAKRPLDDKLSAVNEFFNRIDYADDERLWGQPDYWATPGELLSAGAGDCEDMSIAKYFTLRRLGVPAERLRLTYVKVPSRNMSHMVLSYYEGRDADPLVLDTMVPDIVRASNRTDLDPVYSFDAESLWVALARDRDVLAGKAEELVAWRSVLGRVAAEQDVFSMSGDI